MRHVRFDIATLAVEGVAVPLRAAYLLVAEADDAAHPQWECLAYALGTEAIPPGRYAIDLVTLDGRTLAGPAVRVRSVEGAHVLRGDGPLADFDPADLA